MANLLVTGGAGFIGVNFVYHWLEHHPDDKIGNTPAIKKSLFIGHRRCP